MGYIYKITNKLNGKIYIGKTSSTVEKRFKEHLIVVDRCIKNQDKSYYKHSRLYNSMCKYGVENFEIEEVECVDDALLNEREIYWISTLKTQDVTIGYNIANGGTGGATLSTLTKAQLNECRDKMSKSQKLRWSQMTDEEKLRISKETSQKLKGKYYLSEEAKERGRLKLLGRKQSIEEIQKRSNSLREWHKTHLEEDLKRNRKISESKKGNVVISNEQREQISNTLKEYYKNHKPYIVGKEHTEDTKKKIRDCHVGRVHVTNGVQDKQIKLEDLEEYLKNGWVRGRTKINISKKVICKETNEIVTTKEIAQKFNIDINKVRYHIRNKTPIENFHFEYLKTK